MNIKAAVCALLLASPLLAACAHDLANGGEEVSTFGEPNRQTMMAQVIDPDPEYEFNVHDSSAEHAAQAIERYRADKVKQPDTIRSTEVVGN